MTSQASPRSRWTSTTRAGAHEDRAERDPDRDQPGGESGAGEDHREVGEQGDDAGPGEVAAVAGADQHAVEHEDHTRDRLPDGRDDQDGHQEVLHGGVVGEEPAQERARHREQHAGDDAADRAPTAHRGGDLASARDVPAPSERPVSAWAAMAIASSTKARKVQRHRELVGGQVHGLLVPAGGTERDGVRRREQRGAGSGSAPPGHAGPSRGGGCRARAGAAGAPCRRAARATTSTKTAALASWARTDPSAEPAMPRPAG